MDRAFRVVFPELSGVVEVALASAPDEPLTTLDVSGAASVDELREVLARVLERPSLASDAEPVAIESSVASGRRVELTRATFAEFLDVARSEELAVVVVG